MSQQPQDPYASYILSASAGCGKTYQLSRRFLFLVGAGAKPADILAITFTKKAANEMSQRIVAEAAKLVFDETAANEFDTQLNIFYRELCDQSDETVAPPRLAAETGKIILAATQQLRITTIDSTFWEWVSKFPLEASGLHDEEGSTPLPTGFELSSRKELADYFEKSFNTLLTQLFDNPSIDLPEAFLGSQGLYGLKNRFDQLGGFSTFLWLQRKMRDGQAPLNTFASPALLPDKCDDQTIMTMLDEPLREILPLLNAKIAEEVATALANKDWQSLWQSKFITNKDARISGTYLRGKKRESVAPAADHADALIGAYYNRQQIDALNKMGGFLVELYHGYSLVCDELKFADNRVEFADLAKGCFRLFYDIDAVGARFLIHQTTKHLLLDEFQDTSRLQWSIFEPLARELLSGKGSHTGQICPSPSVFIVGDVKQSIYGFREADPGILLEAGEQLEPFGLRHLPLNKSYRTAPSIMQAVNEVFGDLMPDFPEHATATNSSGLPVSPDCGWVQVPDVLAETEDLSAAELEAETVANKLAEMFQNPKDHPVFDKTIAGYRPIEPRDCALLYRNSTKAHLFENALRERGIPCLREQTDGYYGRPEIQDMRAFIRWLAHPADLVSLMQLLASPLAQVSDRDCLRFAEEAKQASDSQHARSQGLLQLLATNGSEAAQHLLAWQEQAKRHSPAALLEVVYRERALPELYRQHFGPGEGDLAAANLLQLLELVYEYEAEGVLAWQILDRTLTEQAEFGQLSNAPTTSNAISLMTIHKSKGLEFPFVGLIDAASQWEKRDRYWVKGEHDELGHGVFYTGSKAEQPVRMDEFDATFQRIDEQMRAESYRLLYVALTRARQYLLVTGHEPARITQNSLINHPEGFLGELRDRIGAHMDFRQSVDFIEPKPPNDSPKDLLPAPHPAALPDIKSVAAHSFGKQKVSAPATGRDKEKARLLGLLIHAGLEAHVKKLPWVPAADWQTFRPKPPYQSKRDEYIQLAETKLAAILDSDTWKNLLFDASEVQAEVPICALQGNRLVRGRIDLVVQKNNETLVVDYKTQIDTEHPEQHIEQISQYCQAWAGLKEQHQPVKGYVLYTEGSGSLEQIWPK